MALVRVSQESRLLDTVDAGVPKPVLYRHLPILKRCVGSQELPLIVVSCSRSERVNRWGTLRDLLLVTRRRLVVTSEHGLFRRLRLHLNVGLNQLMEVAWCPEPEHAGVRLTATAIDGVRERFWIRLGGRDRITVLERVLSEAFASGSGTPQRRR